MAEDKADLVICEACGKHVAEVVAEDGRGLCSLCQLDETGSKRRSKAPDTQRAGRAYGTGDGETEG